MTLSSVNKIVLSFSILGLGAIAYGLKNELVKTREMRIAAIAAVAFLSLLAIGALLHARFVVRVASRGKGSEPQAGTPTDRGAVPPAAPQAEVEATRPAESITGTSDDVPEPEDPNLIGEVL